PARSSESPPVGRASACQGLIRHRGAQPHRLKPVQLAPQSRHSLQMTANHCAGFLPGAGPACFGDVAAGVLVWGALFEAGFLAGDGVEAIGELTVTPSETAGAREGTGNSPYR